MEINEISGRVIGCAMGVHRALGPGLLESTYEACLAVELNRRGLRFDRQVAMPVEYKGVVIASAYRVDFLVEDRVILELKSVAELAPVHLAQLLTYLRVSGHSLGLLINFNVPVLKHGIRRVVL